VFWWQDAVAMCRGTMQPHIELDLYPQQGDKLKEEELFKCVE
jgi:hypothetical protein